MTGQLCPLRDKSFHFGLIMFRFGILFSVFREGIKTTALQQESYLHVVLARRLTLFSRVKSK